MESSTANQTERQRTLAEGIVAPVAAGSRPQRRGAVLAKMLFLGDLAAALLAAGIARLAFSDNPPTDLLYVAVVGLLWPLAGFSIGLYRSEQLSTWASAVSEVPRGFVALLLITWPIFGVAALVGLAPPITVAFATVGAIALFSSVSRTLVRASLHRVPGLRQRTLILGSGVVAGQVVEKIRKNQQFGLIPVGIVDDEVHNVGTPDLPWLGRFADLDKVIKAQNVDRVIIAFTRANHEELLGAIRAARDAGVSVDVVPRLFEFLDGVRALDQIGGLPLLSIGVPVMTSASMAAKRVLDVVGSLALILVFSPVMVVTAIAIKLESRGPVFFRQPRAGRGNESFNLIKFRSMYVDAERRKKELDDLNEAKDGVMFKIREDPRVTRVGRWIRRFSIDELPQLFNVLIGEMSLVGPRPLIFP
ncbi:MAG: exopolysaccharide biosynthesis polyprenyl glycosylphosphotransferase, partial [Solirubrobacterales bacterium]